MSDDGPDPTCVFCQIVAGESPATMIEEDEHTLAFLDIFPAAPGHTLVVPKRHTRDLLSIEPGELSAVTTTAQRVARRLVETLAADGVNVINACGAAAWQTVFHLHLHVIPRFADDSLTQPWTPAPAEPADLAAIAARLGAGAA